MALVWGHTVVSRNPVESNVTPTLTGGAPNFSYGLTIRRTDTKCDVLVVVTTDGSGVGTSPTVYFSKGAPLSTYLGGTHTAPVATTTA